MKTPKIIVLEDEQDIQDVIAYNLSRDGFTVLCSGDGTGGLEFVRDEEPDLVILDLMLPGMDGLDICRQLKGNAGTAHIPIIMVTAKGEESDIVLGLGLGADDYVTKPFSNRELVERVKAVIRRGPLRESEDTDEHLEYGPVSINTNQHQVRIDGEKVAFTITEFRLLQCLTAHPGRVFSREQLMNFAIGPDAYVVERTIDVHVRAVRVKLGPHRDLIETVRGVGYRFADD